MRKVCKGALKAACYIFLALLAEAIMMTAGTQQAGEVAAVRRPNPTKSAVAPGKITAVGDDAAELGTFSFFNFMIMVQNGGVIDDSLEMEHYYAEKSRAEPFHMVGKMPGHAGRDG